MKSLICLATMALSPFALYGSSYTILDLEVLEAQKNYEEFLSHGHDVKPSKRGKHWTEMVHHMATDYVNFQVKRRNFNSKTFTYIEELARWPVLREEEFFQVKRDSYTKSYLKNCFRDGSNPKLCRLQLNGFWHNSPKKPETGFILGRLLQQYFPKEQHWEFFNAVTTSDISEFYCNKAPVQQAILQKLSGLMKEETSDDKLRSKIDQYFNQNCWRPFAKKLKADLFQRDTPRELRQLGFQVLKTKKDLSAKEKDLYYTIFILEGPIVGKIFNEAWHTIRLLGQDHRRREGLIKQLKSLDPLPGEAFGLANTEKSETLVRFLSQNIPEYLDLYGKTCLDYMEGLRVFPKGNPTIQCRDLFKHAKKLDALNYPLQLRYSKLRKF